MRTITVLFMSLFIISCTKKVKEIVEVPAVKDQAEPDKAMGTDTGGGGFADKDAINALNLAKHALAQRIENLPENSFAPYKIQDGFQFGLPEGKRKKWLSKIIRGIEIKRVHEERYNKPLKFNYDVAAEKVYATNYYLDAFVYSKFENLPTKEKMRIVHDLFIDILHEVSHFYGVGQSEETDPQSEQWARDFLYYGMDSFYKCISENDYIFMINKSTGKAFVRYDPLEPGTTLIFHKTPELQYTKEVESDGSGWGMKVMHLPREDHWKTNTNMIPYGDTPTASNDYFVELYDQYVDLASEKGKHEVPSYLKVKKLNSFDPDLGIGWVNYWLGRDNWSGWMSSGFLFGYPELKENRRKYILALEGLRKKDHFELNMDTLEAVYRFGERESSDGKFTFDSKDELKLQCQDFHKQIMISVPDSI